MGMEVWKLQITRTPQSGLPGCGFADEGISLKQGIFTSMVLNPENTSFSAIAVLYQLEPKYIA
jgi:hypothetical protein